jgi:putative spermidine/putrescine transport system substrate-binding protein
MPIELVRSIAPTACSNKKQKTALFRMEGARRCNRGRPSFATRGRGASSEGAKIMLSKIFAAAVTYTFLALPAQAQDQSPSLKGSGEVVIESNGGTYEAAQKKAYFEPFTQETGIRVVLVPYDQAKTLLSVSTGKPDADVLNLSSGVITTWILKSALEPIDYKYFDKETLDGIDPALKQKYGVGAIVYAIVMAYNEREYPSDKPRPQNWVDFFDPKKFPGPRGLAGCGDRLISGGDLEFAMLASGATKDSVYPIDLDRAFKTLAKLLPSVGKWWQAPAEGPQGLVDGNLAMSTAFNGRIYAARKLGAPVAMNWNEALLQSDYWVVPKGSPNRENAMKLLAFISRAQQQADFSNEMAFGPVNKNAYKFIKPELLDWLPGAPKYADQGIRQDYGWWTAVGSDGKTNWERALAQCVSILGH